MLYTKTEDGRQEVQARKKALTPAQRQVLILCDGERHAEDLEQMLPGGALRPALERLVADGLVELADAAPRIAPVEEELSDAQRYRAIVELATSMAAELGFAARIKAQLQIEKAHSVQDLSAVVELLTKHLQSTPLMALRLNKLRQLASA